MKIKTILFVVFIVMSQMALANNSANILLDQVRNGLQSMSANFKQYEVDVNNRTSDVLVGKMWLSAPNQFKWEYLEPAPQLIIANGKNVWIYDEDLEQVTIKPQNNSQNPIYVLLNKELTEKNYIVEKFNVENSQDSIDWVSLTPKVAGEDIKQVWIGIVDNNIRVLKMKNQLDNIVVFEFDQVIENPEIPVDFFTFIPPEGIDIISNAMGL